MRLAEYKAKAEQWKQKLQPVVKDETFVDNYNYSFTASGRMELMDRIGTLILEKRQ